MFRIASLCLCLLVCGTALEAGESAKTVAGKLAAEMGAATMKGDYARLVDLTYDRLIEKLGGREKAIKIIEASMQGLKTKGFTMTSYKVGTPSEVLQEGQSTFVVVPAVLEMAIPKGKVISKSYLLGISSDAGKTWKFVDGAKLDNVQQREELLPKLPAKLVLPTKSKPEVVLDK